MPPGFIIWIQVAVYLGQTPYGTYQKTILYNNNKASPVYRVVNSCFSDEFFYFF